MNSFEFHTKSVLISEEGNLQPIKYRVCGKVPILHLLICYGVRQAVSRSVGSDHAGEVGKTRGWSHAGGWRHEFSTLLLDILKIDISWHRIANSWTAPKLTCSSAPQKTLQCFKTKTPEQFTIDDSQPGPQLSFPNKQDLGDVWGVLKSHSHVELGQAKIYIQIRNLLLWSFSV